jgi:hypothetical protein
VVRDEISGHPALPDVIRFVVLPGAQRGVAQVCQEKLRLGLEGLLDVQRRGVVAEKALGVAAHRRLGFGGSARSLRAAHDRSARSLWRPDYPRGPSDVNGPGRLPNWGRARKREPLQKIEPLE